MTGSGCDTTWLLHPPIGNRDSERSRTKSSRGWGYVKSDFCRPGRTRWISVWASSISSSINISLAALPRATRTVSFAPPFSLTWMKRIGNIAAFGIRKFTSQSPSLGRESACLGWGEPACYSGSCPTVKMCAFTKRLFHPFLLFTSPLRSPMKIGGLCPSWLITCIPFLAAALSSLLFWWAGLLSWQLSHSFLLFIVLLSTPIKIGGLCPSWPHHLYTLLGLIPFLIFLSSLSSSLDLL